MRHSSKRAWIFAANVALVAFAGAGVLACRSKAPPSTKKAPDDIMIPAGCLDSPTTGTAGTAGTTGQAQERPTDESPTSTLSDTRTLRRVSLNLLGRQPSVEQYQALLDATDNDARADLIKRAIEDALESPLFYDQMLVWAHDYLHVSASNLGDLDGSYWTGNLAAHLSTCPAGTTHAGKRGVNGYSYPEMGDNFAQLCDDAAAPWQAVEPWWAPGTSIDVIGRARLANLTDTDTAGKLVDCGSAVAPSIRDIVFRHGYKPQSGVIGCGCGPNLLYCMPYDGLPEVDDDNLDPRGQRRQMFEEPARLFAHVAVNDRPFSDLVLGDYTVVTQKLQHLYTRLARMTGRYRDLLDHDPWWQTVKDPLAWREMQVAKMNPFLLAERQYVYDPRIASTVAREPEPTGIPAAGVLTMPGSLNAFPRERVRAARWLETFACRNFVPPPSDAKFNPYLRDPGTEGVCQHCHTQIDPAAIHFKRFGFGGEGHPVVGGVGPGAWLKLANYGEPYARWNQAFEHDLLIAPVSAEQLKANPDARFLDFLPPEQRLFGQTSDGTIGPLGFAKMLVASGEFDRCAVQRFYERFIGRRLDPGTEEAFIEQLAAEFVKEGRQVRAFIRYLMGTEAFRRGW